MAATYRALARGKAKRTEAHRAHSRRLRNIATGAVIVGLVLAFAVWGGGSLSGIKTLRQVGTSPDGRPILG